MRGRATWIGLVVAGAALAFLVARAPASRDRPPIPVPAVHRSVVRHGRPNIVFILTDDLSWNLVNRRFTPHIVALERRGETFDHYFVTDSLCCPSRATIFTGLFPHDTHVTSNTPPSGGFLAFQRHHLARRTYAVALHRRGYATSMLGKYLNKYGDPIWSARVPRGWTDWHVANSSGYKEFHYLQDDNGRDDRYGGPHGERCAPGGPAADMAVSGRRGDDYGVDVLSRDATRFISRSARRPFAVEVATFAPHKPYTPSPRNACDFPGMGAPRDPSFDTNNVNPPLWLGQRRPLSPRRLSLIDDAFRRRAQSVEAVDALVARVESQLRAEGVLRRTYIVFSSDNGYHMGQHRLLWGKMTAFDSDIRVPLIVTGPGVPHGRIVHEMAQNTDLAPTFEQLAGATPPRTVDGHSLVPLLHPRRPHRPLRWRTLALVEHQHDTSRSDPDFEAGNLGGNPTTYRALRISSPRLRGFSGPVEAVYVEYADGEREFYDIARDPLEQRNVVWRLSGRQLTVLHGLLARLDSCHGVPACWRAGALRRRPAPRRASPRSLRSLARRGV